ncbi:MAG: hypothetical protein WC378_18085, partial [Opitutaceae bacterium]
MSQPRIYLSSPHMGGDEQKLVQEAFDTNWIAPLGPQVDAFEREFAAASAARTPPPSLLAPPPSILRCDCFAPGRPGRLCRHSVRLAHHRGEQRSPPRRRSRHRGRTAATVRPRSSVRP